MCEVFYTAGKQEQPWEFWLELPVEQVLEMSVSGQYPDAGHVPGRDEPDRAIQGVISKLPPWVSATTFVSTYDLHILGPATRDVAKEGEPMKP